MNWEQSRQSAIDHWWEAQELINKKDAEEFVRFVQSENAMCERAKERATADGYGNDYSYYCKQFRAVRRVPRYCRRDVRVGTLRRLAFGIRVDKQHHWDANESAC
jgi:hypothetical protein